MSLQQATRERGALGGESPRSIAEVVAERAQLVDHSAGALQRERLQFVDGEQVVLLHRVVAAAEPLVGAREVKAGRPQRCVETKARPQRSRSFFYSSVGILCDAEE